MPAGDGTGPMGMGPMTGRAAGYCSGYGSPGYSNPWSAGGGRRAFGRGQGFGRGRGFRFWARATGMPGWQRPVAGYPAYGSWQAQPTKEQETQLLEQERDALREEIKALEQEMKGIRERLEELKKEK